MVSSMERAQDATTQVCLCGTQAWVHSKAAPEATFYPAYGPAAHKGDCEALACGPRPLVQSLQTV